MDQSPNPATAKQAPNNPPPPETIDALGLPGLMVHDLVLRYVREHGSASLTILQKALKLSRAVAESVFEQLRKQQFIEIKRTIGPDFLFSLTSGGQQYAAERSQKCRYAGPAPVPLAQYTRTVRSQRIYPTPTEEELSKVFSDLVLSESTLDQIGQAVVSG